MVRTLVLFFGLSFCSTSCLNNAKQNTSNSKKQEDLFLFYDTLDRRFITLPIDFDSLHFLARHVLSLADNHTNPDTLILAKIYAHCAMILRLSCDCESSQALLCCADSSIIIDSYKKALHIHQSNYDTLSNDFSSVLFQLADVYEQVDKPGLSLPLRQQYLSNSIKTNGMASEMTSDAYMFLGNTYESLSDYELADVMYQNELAIRERTNSGHLSNVKSRIIDLRTKRQLHPRN